MHRRALLAGAAALLAAPAIARAAAGDVLRVGNQKGGIRSLLEASGQLKELPFRIEWSEFPNASPLLEALNAGAIDLGNQGDLAFLSVFANGAPIKAIGGSRQDGTAQAILVRGDSPARSLADLRGKKIAGNRAGWGQFLIRAALKREGIAPGDVSISFLAPTDGALAFRSGAVDAWAVWEPYVSIETVNFGARVLVDGRGLTPTLNFLSVNDAALRDRKPMLAEFVRCHTRAWSWAQENYAAYARSTSAITRIPVPVLQHDYETSHPRAVALDAAVVAEMQKAADDAVEFGVLSKPIRVADAMVPLPMA